MNLYTCTSLAGLLNPISPSADPESPSVESPVPGGGESGALPVPGLSDGGAGEPAATEGAATQAPAEEPTTASDAEGAAETQPAPWVSQPFGYCPAVGSLTVTNGMVLAALGVVLALLTALLLRSRRKPAPAAAVEPPPAAPEAPPQPQEPTTADAAPQEAPAAPKVQIRAAYHQHIGAREDQQDSFIYSDPARYPQSGFLAVVADGMGGLANGKAVSSALVRTFDEGFLRSNPQRNGADLLLELAVKANAHVNRMLQGQKRSGSTLVAALVKNGYLHFLTVGDSRLYLYRGGALLQLNREHIFQEELAVKAVNQDAPLARVRTDRQAHSLTSYFGIGAIPALDRNDEGIKLIDGDRILLATDGVFGTLTAAALEAALANAPNDAATIIGEKILAANKPHQDNNTAVILEYHN